MTCDELRQKLDAFIDDSLAPDELAPVNEHFQACPSCSAEALSRLQIKRATRTAASRYAPSPAFRLRVEEAIQRKRRPAWSRGWIPAAAAFATTLLFVILSGALWLRNSARQQAVAQLVDLHVATLASSNPVDVVSTDRHTVKPWFQGKLPFTFNLPELENSRFKLLGGRVDYLGHSPAAHLLFELNKHDLSVFIEQQSKGSFTLAGGRIDLRENGFNVESWDQSGLRYMIVSDASASDVNSLADLFRAAAR
jgi:anti-sigma factor RsiW